jgi:hypothetical protein
MLVNNKKPHYGDPVRQAMARKEHSMLRPFLEARKQWLDELNYTEKDVIRDKKDGTQWVWVDCWRVNVPKELVSVEEFLIRVRSHE